MLDWLFEGVLSIVAVFFNFLQMTPEQVVAIMIIPLIVDSPRAFGKAFFLLLHGLYERLFRRPYGDYFPMVSVIIPAHNEERVIERSILAFLELEYPRKEIIVVDDGSTDRTFIIAQKYAKQGLIKLFHRDTASGKKAIAVNYGLLLAQGDVVVMVDADTLLERLSLFTIVSYLADREVGAVAGNIRVLNQKNLLTRLQAYEYLMAMEMGRRFQAITGTLMIIPGAFGAVRKELLRGVGSYDIDTITEDFDVTVKLHKTTRNVRFAYDAIGWTVVPERWTDWMRQRVRWTAGQLQTLIKHRDMFFHRYFGVVGLIAAPDMLFMDILLLFVRTAWLVALPLFYPNMLLRLMLLIFLFYMVNELALVLAAGLLSPRKRDLLYALLMPVMVLFYRPFYGLVRLKAYIEELHGLVAGW